MICEFVMRVLCHRSLELSSSSAIVVDPFVYVCVIYCYCFLLCYFSFIENFGIQIGSLNGLSICFGSTVCSQ